MKNISIYGEPGSCNHGNEAIVRGVCNILQHRKITVYSADKESGYKFHLNKTCNLVDQGVFDNIPLLYKNVIQSLKLNKLMYFMQFKNVLHNVDGIYMLEAGDQYCQTDKVRNYYAFVNKRINKLGGKTIMLGCTIDRYVLKSKSVIDDLNRYSLIVARESITYNNLKRAGLKKVTLLPCPAFAMVAQECKLPEIFQNDVVGINVGYLSQGNEKYYDILDKNYEKLVDYIINNTSYNIAFISHVNWGPQYSDYDTISKYYYKYKCLGRVELIKDQNAMRLKFIISKCKYIVALRTHASVAALSSKVPTILTGYKTKTTGIVRDIMNGDESLILPLQSIDSDILLINKFKWLEANYNEVKLLLDKNIPEYIRRCFKLKEYIEKL